MDATEAVPVGDVAGCARPAFAASTARRGAGLLRFARRNPALVAGAALLAVVVGAAVLGGLVIDSATARPLSAPTLRPPSWAYPLGTDKFGRNLLAVMVVGTPNTLKVGLIAGLVGVGVATTLACAAAYYGGAADTLIRWVVDVGLTIPSLLILVLVAIYTRGVTVEQMALVVAAFAWMWPARTLRSQALTLRRRRYVELAWLSGMGGPAIIAREILPNLLPLIAATFVAAVSSAILATIGLEALGLGPVDTPTLGMTIYWVMVNSAVLQGQWWWWSPPIAIIAAIFVALFLLSIGLDRLANPRLRDR